MGERQIPREGNNILVRGVRNGERIPLSELGIAPRQEIKRRTVLNGPDIYVGYDG